MIKDFIKKQTLIFLGFAGLLAALSSSAQKQFIPLFPAQKNGLWGVADINGKSWQQEPSKDTVWAVTPEYDTIMAFNDFCNGYYMAMKKGNYILIESKKGSRSYSYQQKELLANENIIEFEELHNYVFMRAGTGKWCAYIPMNYCSYGIFSGFVYDSVYSTTEKDIQNKSRPVVWVVKNGEEFFLENEKITPKRYFGKTVGNPVRLATGNPNYTREIYFTGLKDKWGIDTKTSTLVHPEYDEIVYLDPLTRKPLSKCFFLRKDRHWYVYNFDSNKIVGNKSAEIKIYDDEFITREQDGSWRYKNALYDSVIIYEDLGKTFYFGARGTLSVSAIFTGDSSNRRYSSYHIKELPPIRPLATGLIMRDISNNGQIVYSDKRGKWGIKSSLKGNPDLVFADFDYIETYQYQKNPDDTFNIPNGAIGFTAIKNGIYLNILPGQSELPHSMICVTYCTHCQGIGRIGKGYSYTTGGETKEGTYAITVTGSYKTYDPRSQSWVTTNQVYKKYTYKTPEKVVSGTTYTPCTACRETGRFKKQLTWNKDHYEILTSR